MMVQIGQVSLPVLSRKGHNDYWHNSWISKKNYSMNFNEDMFIKLFCLYLFSYSVSTHKVFSSMFFKPQSNSNSSFYEYTQRKQSSRRIFESIRKFRVHKYYASTVYLCKIEKWLLVYLFVYKLHTRTKFTSSATHKAIVSPYLLYQQHVLAKQKYVLQHLTK